MAALHKDSDLGKAEKCHTSSNEVLCLSGGNRGACGGSFCLVLDAAGSAQCAVALAGAALAVSAADLHPPIPVAGGWQLLGDSDTAETIIKSP